MELLLYFIALYLWQCLVFLPPGAVCLKPRHRHRGPGPVLFSPWPGPFSSIVGGWPFEPAGPLILTPARRFHGLGALDSEIKGADLREADWTSRGSSVFRNGRRFLTTVSKTHASHVCGVLRRLAAVDDPAARLNLELDRSFDLETCRKELHTVRRHTLGLRLACALYGVAAFIALPAAWGWLPDTDAVWRLFLPILAGLHLVAVAALLYAVWRLPAPDRLERVFVAALFPPALLRAPVELASDLLVRYHPATVAAVLLRPETRRRFLLETRTEYAIPPWCRFPPTPEPTSDEAMRRPFLTELAKRIDTLAEQLDLDLRPEQHDPTAASFCPRCAAELRDGFTLCSSCGIETQSFRPARPAEAASR